MTENAKSDLAIAEIKSVEPADINSAFDAFMRDFELYKEENERRLNAIERHGAADPLTIDKLNRLDRMFDDLTHKQLRPKLSAQSPNASADDEQMVAFGNYIRRGDAHRLAATERKDLSAGQPSEGGYLVPAQTEAVVNRALKDISPIRSIASVRQVSSLVYKQPFAIDGTGTGWVGEKEARTKQATPTLSELTFQTMELYAMPAATQTLLDDSAVDIDQWIAEEVRLAFAEQEGKAFVNGDGTNKPKGFLNYDTVADAGWVHGKIGFLTTGASGAFPSADPADKLIDLIYSLKSGYRANANFVMNRATQAVLRKMKDGEGQYLWQPAPQARQASTIMGFPVVECEVMPDIAANSFSIAFGDFGRGYLVVDRIGISILRDPYSSKPYVLFYTTKRVGGGVQDFEAIKLLKFAA